MSLLTMSVNDNILTITLCGRIDSGNADEVRKEIEEAAEKSLDGVIVDAVGLEYISSVGLREMLKLKNQYNNFEIVNVLPAVYDIFEMTGFTGIMTVKRAFRQIYAENCPLLGKGACGAVYKLDNETIVKVFVSGYGYDKIIRERDNSRNAFTHGIDTAIPFDIVKVGENYGLIYEIINADTLKSKILKEPEKSKYYIGIYAGYIRNMHGISFEKNSYPDMKTSWAERIDALQGIFTDDEKQTIKKFICDIPDRDTFVHGDINFGNLMINDGKAVMIDMEEAVLGHPIFDIAFLYYFLKLLPELLPEGVYKLMTDFTAEEAEDFWNEFAEVYFDCRTGEERAEYEKEIHPYGIIRLLDGVPACYLIFNSYDEKIRNEINAVYRSAAEKRKSELLEALKTHVKPLTF